MKHPRDGEDAGAPESDERVTWENTISKLFTQLDIGCMRGVTDFDPRLDLASYESVVSYRMNIYYALKKGQMPPGGPRWSDEKLKLFHHWMSQNPPPRK